MVSYKSILLIRPEWLNLILKKEKTIELRGSSCKSKIGDTIGLAYCGPTVNKQSRYVVATVTIKSCNQYLSSVEFKNDFQKHKFPNDLPYKKTFKWELFNLHILANPQDFLYKKGAVIWVNT